jgi:hypothetical protein
LHALQKNVLLVAGEVEGHLGNAARPTLLQLAFLPFLMIHVQREGTSKGRLQEVQEEGRKSLKEKMKSASKGSHATVGGKCCHACAEVPLYPLGSDAARGIAQAREKAFKAKT